MRRPTFLDGPPVALPELLDRASERLWALTPRRRAVVFAATVLVALAGLASRGGSAPSVEVLVATRDIAAGAAVAPGVTTAERPASSIPVGALDAVAPDTVALAPIPRGGVIASMQVSRAGLAAAVSPGHVATAVPVGALPAAVSPRQRVDLLAAAPDGQTRVLASGALVIAVGEEHVWFELSRDEAAAVASAAAWGQIGVALLPQVTPTADVAPDGGEEAGQ